VITARRTRLARVADLHQFRRAIHTIARSSNAAPPSIVVPTASAARQLVRCLGTGAAWPLTREQLYDTLHARLRRPPGRLTVIERDAIAQAAAAEAANETPDLSFQVRPGLVAEMLRFYDQLRRQSQRVGRFEELTVEALGGESASDDRGSIRLMRQTRFLAAAFRAYERRLHSGGALDEHALRERLIAEPAADPLRHLIVTVADWIADPDGLFAADFDLLARLPGLECLDIVATDGTLNSGFDERLRNWWPGLEETVERDLLGVSEQVRPILLTPDAGNSGQVWFTFRDREEELLAVARRHGNPESRDGLASGSIALVFKHPLPYIYLAPATLGAAGIPYEASDALPLAAEPVAAAIDLVLELTEKRFVRSALVALLRSPHFRFANPGGAESREAIASLDLGLSESRYLGELPNLERLIEEWAGVETRALALQALLAAVPVCRMLTPLLGPAAASSQLGLLRDFLRAAWRPLDEDDPFLSRERRSRKAVEDVLTALAGAHRAHHDPPWTIDDLAGAVRRWVGEQTFDPHAATGGIQLLDDQAARYGEFDHLALVGLLEHEWPERPKANIFYPVTMLRSLGWPSEQDRRGASDGRFLDLLSSATRMVSVSTVTLDDDAVVTRSPQLDEIHRAGLSAMAETARPTPSLPTEAPADGQPAPDRLNPEPRAWLRMRMDRPGRDLPAFHGSTGTRPPREWSVSALETYLDCPFKFFALHVLKLREEPDDEEVMDPRRQGQLVHTVFESFFKTWQEASRGAITPADLDDARRLFEEVVDRELARLPPAEAGLERTRLLGSPAAAGLGEAVFRMEAERPVPVVERLLEHRLAGAFSIATQEGSREVRLRGKADRLDLLEDGTFRLIDYKLGWPPNRARALQLPIYGLCAEERLASYRGRSWALGEAMYLAFKGPKRVVPLFTSAGEKDKSLGEAQTRLAQTIDAIERGEFPPTPDDVYRCEMCDMASVCRKDYVGDVRT
jgi:RecB family exonuclease/inactivated superfamily I helicase